MMWGKKHDVPSSRDLFYDGREERMGVPALEERPKRGDMMAVL